MRLRKLKFLMMFAAVAVLLAHTSCIKENRDDCPPPFNLRVIVEADAGIKLTYPERYNNISSVWIYVFGSDGKFVTSWNGPAFSLTKEYVALFSLPDDNYSFVVRTNLGTFYKASHTETQLRDGLHQAADVSTYLDLAVFSGREITSDIPDSHGGLKNATVKGKNEQTITIPIVPHTYKVNFVVTGLTGFNPAVASNFTFTVTDKDFQHNFENDKSARLGTTTVDYKYLRTAAPSANMTASMIILGLDEPVHTPAFIFSHNTTPTVVTLYQNDDLIEMIREAYKAQKGSYPDFTKVFEFTVPFRFTTDMGVTLDLNYWDSIENPTYL